MESTKYYLGLDVGGTNMVAGVVDENHQIIAKESIPTQAGRTIEEITADMAEVSKKAVLKAGLQMEDISSWGIGMPSYVNPKTNLLVHANCFGWKNVPIYDYLKKHISLPTYIANDANCATYGEVLAGSASQYTDAIMLTLGTGVGGGIIMGKRIYSGADNMGAELGHTKLVYNGERCTCGQKGCLEAYCSSTALIRIMKEALQENKDTLIWKLCGEDENKVNGEILFEAAKQGDSLAKQIVDDYISKLAAGISTFITIFRPQNGLRIKDKFSLCTSVSRIPVVTELAPDAMYDVIFVVLRYTQLDSALDTLRANRTKNIVFVGNNVQARALAAALPEKNVLFAFALSAGHREADRVVSIDLKKITIGQLPGAISNKQLIGRIFHGTKYKVVYEPNMEDYLLCHAAFVMPAAFACYKTDGDLKKLRGDTAYLNRVLDANIEGYRAIRDAGHTILPKEDADFEGEKYRKTCLRFFKLMCATSLGKLCASDHAMNAIDEMSALNRDLKKFFDENGAAYPVWQALEAEAGRYLQ